VTVTNPIEVLFLLVALILFILAAFGVSGGKINLVAAGLACFVAAFLFPALGVR